jgi:hypothetical protein
MAESPETRLQEPFVHPMVPLGHQARGSRPRASSQPATSTGVPCGRRRSASQHRRTRGLRRPGGADEDVGHQQRPVPVIQDPKARIAGQALPPLPRPPVELPSLLAGAIPATPAMVKGTHPTGLEGEERKPSVRLDEAVAMRHHVRVAGRQA